MAPTAPGAAEVAARSGADRGCSAPPPPGDDGGEGYLPSDGATREAGLTPPAGASNVGAPSPSPDKWVPWASSLVVAAIVPPCSAGTSSGNSSAPSAALADEPGAAGIVANVIYATRRVDAGRMRQKTGHRAA
mmetsp:Transcript_20360/g.57961  ORF Transcript_20360/g.57961 Transcript_20360/m.57961 type:complete len:133 (+) Transcript_20360:283-681(+)